MKKEMMLIVMTGIIAMYGTYVNAQCDADHDHSAHAKKEVIEEKTLKVGENAAVIKLSHNKTDGKVTIVVLKSDKTPLVLEKAPRLNLFADGKRKQIKTEAVGDSKNKFEAKDESLKKDLNGKVALKIGDKSYQVAINPPSHDGHGPDCNH